MADLTADVAESHRKAPHQVPGPPPSPEEPEAPTALTYREKLALLLGGPGSGHHGHEGVPGQRGGSAPKGGGGGGTGGGTGGVALRTPTKEDRDWIDKNTTYAADEVSSIGDKPDGGKLVMHKAYTTEEYITKYEARRDAVLKGTHDPEAIAVQMFSHLPGDVKVTWAYGKNDEYPDAEVLDVLVSGDKGLHLGRQFIRHPDGALTVHHDAFMVPKAQQGKGLAKTVLADSMAAYREMGVTRVTTQANDSRGAYAWAKFGFTADQPQELAKKLTARVNRAGRGAMSPVLPDATPAQQAHLRALIDTHKDDPQLPWHIAGVVGPKGEPVGKALLWEMDWAGSLDMQDAASMARFDHYTKRGAN